MECGVGRREKKKQVSNTKEGWRNHRENLGGGTEKDSSTQAKVRRQWKGKRGARDEK